MKGLKCNKCGHEWLPRVANPGKCPGCQRVLEKVGTTEVEIKGGTTDGTDG